MGGSAGAKGQSAGKTLVFAGALYDLIAVGPLAIPGLATIQLNIMFMLNNWLGFAGGMPDFGTVEMLFVNLFGLMALLWITRRIFRYEDQLLSWDLLFRCAVVALLSYYAVQQDVHRLIWIFLIVELSFVIAYCLVLWRKRHSQ
jgi:hypothetical protein